ncbi:MAG: XRE family transcriptional regulator [Oscillospiraceae bacterium]
MNIKELRKKKGFTQKALAERLGVERSTISMWETEKSKPSCDVLEEMADLFQVSTDQILSRGDLLLHSEGHPVLEKYRALTVQSQNIVDGVLNGLLDYETKIQAVLEEEQETPPPRMIPLYATPAAAGYASPDFGTDFEYIPVEGSVPSGADFAVRVQGDSMEPFILDDSIVYVNRDPMAKGDVGIFCVDGDMFCKQYYKDETGTVYLLSLNRTRADADLVLPATSGRNLVWYGRVILEKRPRLPRLF